MVELINSIRYNIESDKLGKIKYPYVTKNILSKFFYNYNRIIYLRITDYDLLDSQLYVKIDIKLDYLELSEESLIRLSNDKSTSSTLLFNRIISRVVNMILYDIYESFTTDFSYYKLGSELYHECDRLYIYDTLNIKDASKVAELLLNRYESEGYYSGLSQRIVKLNNGTKVKYEMDIKNRNLIISKTGSRFDDIPSKLITDKLIEYRASLKR